MIKKIFDESGQTMIEALVALGIAVGIIAAITTIVISSLNGATFTKNQNSATNYAQQALDSVRSGINANYTGFLSTYGSSSYCLDSDNILSVNTSNCNAIKTGIFTKEVDFAQNSPDCQGNLLATVIVSWSDSRCTNREKLYCHAQSVSTCFANINTVPSPL